MLSFAEKTAMRRIYSVIALGALLLAGLLPAGCERLDTPFGRSTGRDGSGLAQRDSSSATTLEAPDTVCWTAVVKVPDGYDWHRDTLAGRFSGELLLYRDSRPCLTIPLDGSVPVSPDPGTHHIIRGHLYTECSSGAALHILRDGVPLLHLPGEGFLKGLLLRDDGLWTLACTPADGSLSLCRNGETLVRIARGSAVGGIGEGRPALYEDAGHICFSYSEGGNLFAVTDGGIVPVPPPEQGAIVEDFRWRDGTPITLYRKNGAHHIYSSGSSRMVIYGQRPARLVEADGGLYVFGMSDFGLRDIAFAAAADGSGIKYYYGRESWLHGSEAGLFTVQGSSPLRISDGTLVPTAPSPHIDKEGVLVFTDECVASIGGDPWLGVSVPGGRPLLMRGGEAVGEFPFDGYITAVDVEIIPPS